MIAAKAFGDAYRAERGLPPLETERREGVEHLVSGQYAAVWTDDEETLAELSYIPWDGHRFVIVCIDGDTMEPMALEESGRAYAIIVDGSGGRETLLPETWSMSDDMRAALDQLKPRPNRGSTST